MEIIFIKKKPHFCILNNNKTLHLESDDNLLFLIHRYTRSIPQKLRVTVKTYFGVVFFFIRKKPDYLVVPINY